MEEIRIFAMTDDVTSRGMFQLMVEDANNALQLMEQNIRLQFRLNPEKNSIEMWLRKYEIVEDNKQDIALDLLRQIIAKLPNRI